MYALEDIIIYPIKGLRGISISESKVFEEGLEHDRRWMLVDDAGVFISQRTHKKLARFKVSILNDKVEVEYEGDAISFSIDQRKTENVLVSVWDHHNLLSKEVDAKVSHWFSQKLNTSCKLVRHLKETNRIKTIKDYSTQVSFADGYPFLFLGTRSLDFLNEKLKSEINGDRFRPNFIIKTTSPHEEDDWREFKIGSVTFRNIKPCVRCMVPNIDQTTGKLGNEPNKTLSNYRKVDDKIFFGTNVIALDYGKVSLTDKLELCNVHRD